MDRAATRLDAAARRVTRPGGVALLTTHGASIHGELREKERAVLDREGFLFLSGVTGRLKTDGLPDFYQVAFHTRAYIERRWTAHFRVTSFIDQGVAGHQDLVVLQ